MTTRIRQRYAIIIGAALTLSVLIIGLSLYGAGQLNPAPAASDKLAVAATIFPLADIARNIGGDYVNVTLIIPPGASEHASDLSPRQLQSLAQAQAIFQIGHGLDTALTARIAAATKTAELVTVDRGISLGEFSLSGEDEHDHDSGIDPHYWLTVPNAKLIAQTISQTLQELDPANATHYSLQTTNYLAELDALEQELQTLARAASTKEFIAMHNAWSYLADHYGLQLVGTYEPTEGRQPSLQDIQVLQKLIAQHSIKTFYAEPQKQSAGATRLLAQDLGLTIQVLDPVGGLPPYDSYITLMRENLRALAAAD